MEVIINDHNKYQYGHGLVVGKSLFSNNHKLRRLNILTDVF
jgi:hypothetical protein